MKESPSKTLRVCSWNSRGLSAAVPYLRSILADCDICTLSEHWLHNNRLSQLSELSSDFNFCARASTESSEERYGIRRGQGGVGILWRKSLRGVSVIETIKHDRICGIRVQTEEGAVLVFLSVYMPAVGSRTNLLVTLNELEGIIGSLDDDIVPIVCGDFNGDMGTEGGPRGRGAPTRAGKSVLNFLRRQNFTAVNLMGNATDSLFTYEGHNGTSTIDYVMVPKYLEERIISVHTDRDADLNTSDHLPVKVVMSINMLPHLVRVSERPSRIRWDKVTGHNLIETYQVPLYEEFYAQGMYDPHIMYGPVQIDDALDRMSETLHRVAETMPRSKFQSHLKPYWTDELSELKRNKMYWFREWKSNGRTVDDNDPVRVQMKATKKIFAKRLRAVSKQYDNQSIAEAARLAEVDRDKFWRIFKRNNKSGSNSTHAVKDHNGKVVYEIKDILEVWRRHFDALSTPKELERFDNAHFLNVTESVRSWCDKDDASRFLEGKFSRAEVRGAIMKLNMGKAPGYDGITTEHIRYAGDAIVQPLCDIFNTCVEHEYVPCNFRRGIQVPLYKGKNTCSLDPDNYRGITLLTTYNKLFEALIWSRLKQWWYDERIISDLQGATRSGSSCIHTALTLQETISKEREGNRNVFVSYYDVSKAFDSVWVDGLFFQLYKLGIKGSLWRILYKTYVNFNCCVRIGSEMSKWYPMECGIHQGGYLSLVKYTAFIDSLITTLEATKMCSAIYRVPSSPVGYADDVAACTVSKRRMDRVMNVVYNHGNTWRYSFNAKKSAVLVFGETNRERQIGSKNRVFSLGPEKVSEKLHYDHVGVKTCVLGDTHCRTEEKIIKARKVLNMSSSIGIKRGGLNLSTSNLIYWTVIIPILCFGCEIWVIKKKDEELLAAFQRYAARRLQRFHNRSINITSFVCLGWMNIVNYIKARQVIFLRSIIVMKEHMPLRKIFINRLNEFVDGIDNQYDSPMIHALQICSNFDLLNTVKDMVNGEIPSKVKWRHLVWEKAWASENEWWQRRLDADKHLVLVKGVMEAPSYSIWWQISDGDMAYMKRCEVMVRLLCHCTQLKDDDFQFKKGTIWSRMCTMCELAAVEDARHMIMQCPYHRVLQEKMQNEVRMIDPDFGTRDVFNIIMGKPIVGIDDESMLMIWKISCTYTAKMYWNTIRIRA